MVSKRGFCRHFFIPKKINPPISAAPNEFGRSLAGIVNLNLLNIWDKFNGLFATLPEKSIYRLKHKNLVKAFPKDIVLYKGLSLYVIGLIIKINSDE